MNDYFYSSVLWIAFIKYQVVIIDPIKYFEINLSEILFKMVLVNLHKYSDIRALFINDRGVEQLVARWAHNPKVVGSNPAPATREEKGLLSSLFCC